MVRRGKWPGGHHIADSEIGVSLEVTLLIIWYWAKFKSQVYFFLTMTIHLQEVVRSEVEGGLSGPANPIPSQSIDCGCGQLPCPKLTRFATRRMFVGLVCWVGLLQAASSAYFYVIGPTIARRFQLDPYLIDWILVVSELTPFVLGLIVAYWGDKIHRASWIGALVLLQCAAYLMLIIPHLTHGIRVIEEALNVTHMSLYADDSPELCSASSSRIIVEEDDTCYFALAILIFVQIIIGMANIAYYSLSISYLDDNTKKQHVAGFFGMIIAVKVIGVLLGYVIAWGCLRIDAENLQVVESYQEQIGAWWLGFPILALAMAIPAIFLSWFPRRLPSEVVEQAAESILDRAGTMNRRRLRSVDSKIGSPDFCPMIGRLITNKLLVCNILASAFCASALLNFMTHENIILESRYQIPRPTGLLIGFGDPLPSRLISSILKPILIGLIIIIVGLVLSKVKPRAAFIAGYNFIMIVLAAIIIFALVFATCDTPPIVGMDRGSIGLLKYCNKDCRCSRDADFRPVCDIRGTFTFYTPCHAGCTSVEYIDNMKIYGGCSCVEDVTGQGNLEAKEGPCGTSNCQVGWLAFEFGTLFAYSLVASTFIGDLLINLRSVYKQDKASSIGFWMMWVAIFVNVPGKILYQTIADMTCVHWGIKRTICHLHDSEKLGNYMFYLTTLLMAICVLFKVLVWIFCRNLQIYGSRVSENEEDTTQAQELLPISSNREQTENVAKPENNGTATSSEEPPKTTEAAVQQSIPKPRTKEDTEEDKKDEESNKQLKYGPVGPGDRRQDINKKPLQQDRPKKHRIRNLDSDDELDSSSDESKKDSSPKVAYIPLDLDSDVESDLGSTAPRSRKRIVSKDYDEYTERSSSSMSSKRREFPNPDDYGDPRSIRNAPSKNRKAEDGSSKTSSFEYSKTEAPKKGDFNEVGIPIVEYHPRNVNGNSDRKPNSPLLKDVKSLISKYENNTSQERLEDDRASIRSAGKTGIPLVAMAQPRLSSGQASSGFSSLRESSSDARGTPSPKNSSIKGSKGALCTDL
ncbi:hypothetical protein KPH14_009745 [Odynerus spinipes]|uniref:Kazal-like domain-containing protein n=1 Tax=Odynerus spinipes TaxID=1348599 RepID=A0AAD9RFS7_9HYME|nr:hypothetical protein KPH14_009745 [Odynerus spinipes]